MRIYEFPELKPGIRAGNIGWLRQPGLLIRKLKGLGVRRIVIQPFLELYQQSLDRLDFPVVGRSAAGLVLETGDVVLYETGHVAGLAALHADFGCSLESLGIIKVSSDALHTVQGHATQGHATQGHATQGHATQEDVAGLDSDYSRGVK